jgi:hypothetical protein
MMTGREIMERAGILLLDEEFARWTLPELADWINEGVRAIILAKPSAHASTRILSLAEGTWQQVAEVAGEPVPLSLIDIRRNLRDTNSPRVGGRIVRAVSRTMLDAQDPYWHDPTRTRYRKEVRHFVFDEENPLEFYVYPGNDGTGVVEAIVSSLPTRLAASGDENELASYASDIGLPEPYSVPLLDYVCYRAQSKDDLTGNAGRAAAHYQQFATAIGLKIQVEGATSPNARRAN